MKIIKRPVIEQEYVLDTGDLTIQLISINNMVKVLLIIFLIVNAYVMGQQQAIEYANFFMQYRGVCTPYADGFNVVWSCPSNLTNALKPVINPIPLNITINK